MDMSTAAPTSAGMSTGMATMSSMAPMATSSANMDDMGGMGMGNGCKISMLWNWNVVDACFITKSWHIRSKGMFAGSCIGVILLVILLEFLRRAAKEYDHFIVTQHSKTLGPDTAALSSSSSSSADGIVPGTSKGAGPAGMASPTMGGVVKAKFRPTMLQQAVRALLHTCAFAVAYFVMLLAMYYNGYFIICIFIGAYIGYFIFGWESFTVSKGGDDRMQENATVCCG